MLLMLFKLLIGHALGDFALRTEAMSKGKSRHYKPDYGEYLPPGQKIVPVWFYYLTAHALINCGVVWLLTGNPYLAWFELVMHWCIDYWKCEGAYSPHVDQALHILCKVFCAWAWAGGWA